MVKLPLKMKILSIDFHKTQFDGEIEFHEKKFQLRIYPIVDKQTIKIDPAAYDELAEKINI